MSILDDMAETEFKEKLDSLVTDAVKDSVAEIQAMFSHIRCLLIDLVVRWRDRPLSGSKQTN